MRQSISNPVDTYTRFIDQYGPQVTPAEILNLMYLHINEGGSVAAFRNSLRGYVDMAVPFVDDDFLKLILATRVEDRRDSTIHHHLIRSHCPSLMKIANSNNGAPLDASPLRRVLTEKFLAVMRRLSLPGFRHYHNVQTWIRKSLRESVRSLLLEPRSLKRGLYDPTCLQEMLSDSAPPSSSRILPRLVMLEMWFRLFVDREIDDYQLTLDNPDRLTRVEDSPQAQATGSL
jgi:asparagine synthase (glutamine-hydrolysing)